MAVEDPPKDVADQEALVQDVEEHLSLTQSVKNFDFSDFRAVVQ